MDPLTLGIIGGVGALVSGLGGVISLVKEYVKTVTAERALRSTVRTSVVAETNPASGQIERLLGSDPASDSELAGKVAKLVSEMNISESDKKVLLSGLRQPSMVGQHRYAEKLFAEVNESARQGDSNPLAH